jgi:serine/threonine-protein kinase
MIGTTVGHYRIVSKLGEGGVGAVYRATDTKLGRDVAVKVLPDAFGLDGERLARFTREAQVLASLNHPNIAAIYGVEERALVMELVEGSQLQGPVPVETALGYARQIAEALEAAHEKGIVHRDLKPANVLVTADGVVKVLDFGLAKAAEPVASANPANSPTLTMGATEVGLIMGTAGYMSPEQAAGKVVDKRADIWAFGVVLFELVTGESLFAGETVSHTLAHVLTREIDLSRAPAAVRPLLERCLDRDVKTRLRDIGEARVWIQRFSVGPVEVAAPVSGRRGALAVLGAGVLGAVAGGLGVGWWKGGKATGEKPLQRFTVDLPGQTGEGGLLSPDGTSIVYFRRGAGGERQLAMRRLGQSGATEFAPLGSWPIFSPDGQWVAHTIGTTVTAVLVKVPVQGGAPVEIGKVPGFRGGWWGADGTIVYGTAPGALAGGKLYRIPASGGNAASGC